jgi:hypothetical protein
MTMIVDRRKDNYDELLVLARDARVSRSRANRWTTGLVIVSVAVASAYIATVNQQVDQLRETAEEAVEQRDAIRSEYVGLLDERNVLKGQMDIVARYEDKYADIVPALILGNRIKDIGLGVAGNPDGAPPAPQFALSNLVWIVDGSRRFPLTSGDILWVPEDKFWVEMESGPNAKPNTVTIHRGKRPVQSTTGGTPVVFNNDPTNIDQNVHRMKVKDAQRRGIANCIKLTYHKDSSRFGFTGEEFVDIEVLFYNNPACPDRQPPPQPDP